MCSGGGAAGRAYSCGQAGLVAGQCMRGVPRGEALNRKVSGAPTQTATEA